MSLLARHSALRERIRREELRKAIVGGTLAFRGAALMYVTDTLTLSQPDPYPIPWHEAILGATDALSWHVDEPEVTIETAGIWTIHAHGYYEFGPYGADVGDPKHDARGGLRVKVNDVAKAEQSSQVTPAPVSAGLYAIDQALSPPLVLEPADVVTVEVGPSVYPDTDWTLKGTFFAELVLWTEI